MKFALFVWGACLAIGAFFSSQVLFHKSVNLTSYFPQIGSKEELIFFSMMLFGTIQLINIFAVIFCRVTLNRPDPLKGEEPLAIRTLNRALDNALQHASVFFPAFTYFTLYKSTPADFEFLQNLALLFVVGRAFFVPGYLLSLIGASGGRHIGTVMSISSSLCAVLLCYGIRIF